MLNVGLCQPPHLYFVIALPSKTHTTANIDATFLADRTATQYDRLLA